MTYGNNSVISGSGWRLPVFTYNPNNLTLVFDTSKEPANNTVSVLMDGSINCTVYWGDGLSDTYVSSSGWKTHTYSQPGVYVVQIAGTMTKFGFTSSGAATNNKLKLVRCLSFGSSVQQLSFAFTNCTNLVQCPSSFPATATDLRGTFSGCSFFNDPNVRLWNTASVTLFSSMFNNCSRFNVPLNSWNVSSATTMSSMFAGCTQFNQPLNSWNVSNVNYMDGLFASCSAFNQPLDSWNVSKVARMQTMFFNASAFAQDLSSWNIRRVTDMSQIFGTINAWGTTNYSNALNAWASLSDTALVSNAITNITDAGSGRILITTASAPDAYITNQRVRISGTVNYNGDYTITSRPSSIQFTVTKTFVANETTGTADVVRSRNVALGVGNTKYSINSLSARNFLTSQYAWTITDGGAQFF